MRVDKRLEVTATRTVGSRVDVEVTLENDLKFMTGKIVAPRVGDFVAVTVAWGDDYTASVRSIR